VVSDFVDAPGRNPAPAQDVLQERPYVRRPLRPAERHDEHGVEGTHQRSIIAADARRPALGSTLNLEPVNLAP
jgi:hypothetical protein